MTPINLMDRLAAKLQKLMDDYSTKQPSGTLPIKVYPGFFSSANRRYGNELRFVCYGQTGCRRRRK